jgi:NRPS condensation-like uncharacterized protein
MDHRIVSPIEMYSVARNNADYYKAVVFYIRFQTSSFSLSDWKLRIEKALRLTIEAQPRLRLQVDLSRKQPYFIILPISVFDTLPIRIFERSNDDEEDEFLNKILEDETNTGFVYNQTSPLWRIALLVSSENDNFDMILTFNHAIGDGMSGMGFFTTLLDCLSERSTRKFSLDNDRPSYELISSKLPPLSSFLLKILEKLLLPNFLSQYFFPKTYWTGDTRLTGDESPQTRLVSFELSSTNFNLLHKKCQMEQTTIHAAIAAAILLSITEVYGKRNLELSCASAVNIRRFCQPIISDQQMGVFVSTVDSTHYIPYVQNLIDLFWPLAREVKQQINQEVEHSALPLIQSLKFVSNWDDYLHNQRKAVPNGYQHSLDVSNILRWSFESNDPSWKILHGGFSQSANIIGSAFTVSVVTVNEILNVYLCYQEQCFKNIEQVKVMKERTKQFLVDVIRDKSNKVY